MSFREWLRFVRALADEKSLDVGQIHEALETCGRPELINVTVKREELLMVPLIIASI